MGEQDKRNGALESRARPSDIVIRDLSDAVLVFLAYTKTRMAKVSYLE